MTALCTEWAPGFGPPTAPPGGPGGVGQVPLVVSAALAGALGAPGRKFWLLGLNPPVELSTRFWTGPLLRGVPGSMYPLSEMASPGLPLMSRFTPELYGPTS